MTPSPSLALRRHRVDRTLHTSFILRTSRLPSHIATSHCPSTQSPNPTSHAHPSIHDRSRRHPRSTGHDPTLTHRLWGCIGEVVGSPRADRCVLRVCDDRGATTFGVSQASLVIISGFAPYSQRLISDCVGGQSHRTGLGAVGSHGTTRNMRHAAPRLECTRE